MRPAAQDVQLRQEMDSAVATFLAGEDGSDGASGSDEAEADGRQLALCKCSLEVGCVCTGLERGWCSSALRFLAHVAALFCLQLPLAAVTEGFDALAGSHSRRSSACGSANHAIAGGGSV